jgi:gliding-associated putative ABC transporter substrate-binding component GldG
MLTRKKLQTTVLLVFGILVLINILSYRFFTRLDFTEDHRYSLSKATKDIIGNLDDPVTITAYFTENLPPNIEQVRKDFKDLLVEYSNYSDGQVVYEFVNPNESQETEMEAQRNGVQPIMINVREKDQMKQQRAYLGAVIRYEDKKEVIPFIKPGAAMEYELSSAIKKITLRAKPEIGFLQGHGEPTLDEMQQWKKSMDVLYKIKEIKLSDTTGIPPTVNTLVVIAPKDSFSAKDLSYLDEFIKRGGRLLAAVNRVDGNFQTQQGKEVKSNFFEWLKKYGVDVEPKFIVDVNCSNVMVRQQQGLFVMSTPVSFPYIPVITRFAKHPITEGLESVMMKFVSPVKAEPKDTTISVTVLARTSEKSGLKTPPLYFDIMYQWRKSDFLNPSLPVAVAMQGKLGGEKESRLVVFGDGDFAVNGKGNSAQQLQEDNVSLLSNAVDWLNDDTGLIALRTKGVTSRPIDVTLSDSTKMIIKYVNFLLPILLIVIYGVIRFQTKKKIRKQIQSVDYV